MLRQFSAPEIPPHKIAATVLSEELREINSGCAPQGISALTVTAMCKAPQNLFPNSTERCCGIFDFGTPKQKYRNILLSTLSAPQVEGPFAGFATSVQISSLDFPHFPNQW